jgi:hypothetical protein
MRVLSSLETLRTQNPSFSRNSETFLKYIQINLTLLFSPETVLSAKMIHLFMGPNRILYQQGLFDYFCVVCVYVVGVRGGAVG